MSFNEIVDTLNRQGHTFSFKRVPKEVYATLFPGAAEFAEMFSYFQAHTYLGSDSHDRIARLLEAVKKSGLKYMMFETSAFHEDLYAMRQIYNAGGFGKLVYSEGEYFHYMEQPIDSYKGWRIGSPPQFYPTHSNAYYHCVTGGSFTEVSCIGMPSVVEHFKPANNGYKNPFGTGIALCRTTEGGTSRMAVSWDTPGYGGEMGRVRGQRGNFYGQYEGPEKNLPDIKRPPLPPGVSAGGTAERMAV